MDFIKTTSYGTPVDVIFDGRYIFIDKWHGLVAIVRPVYDDDCELVVVGYKIERTLAIDPKTIKRTIKKYRSDFNKRYDLDSPRELTFEDAELHQVVGSLPYGIELNIRK